jgi:hypothetical protein
MKLSLILLVVSLVTCLVWFEPLIAHDALRPQLDSWFYSLHNQNGYPCCDASEAIRVEDPDWESHDGHYRVKLGSEWFDVPDGAVIKGPNLAGHTMVWPSHFTDKTPDGVRCFMPGAMT